MSNDQRMKFALAVLNKTLQHFDAGGPVMAPGQIVPAAPLQGPGGGTTVNSSSPPSGLAGGIGGLLGLNNNFEAGSANIQAGTNQDQLNNAYSGVQNALQQQQMLANSVIPGSMQAATSQQILLRQLENQSQGVGPNPVQAQLAQNTAANTSNQAALMASQRGASANPGLVARMAAQQGALNQQNMVGQAATLQAQQQLAAQQALASQQAQLVNQGQQGVGAHNQAQQNEQQILQNANTAANNAAVSMQSNMNNTNAQTAAGNQQMGGSLIGGIAKGISGGLFAEGGEVPQACMHCGGPVQHLAAGGVAQATPAPMMPANVVAQPMVAGPQYGSHAGQWLNAQDNSSPYVEQTNALPAFKQQMDLGTWGPDRADAKVGDAGQWETGGGLAGGDDLAGQVYAAAGGEIGKKIGKTSHLANKGGGVPGKPNVKGDSYKNDTVPAMLSPGEVVIPKHVMESKDPVKNAAKFVQAVLAKKQGLRKSA